MLFTKDEKEIIQSHFYEYCDDINNEVECKYFMFNLEQHLAFKSLYEELNSVENQLFYVLLSNNTIENGYPNEMVTLFEEILTDIKLQTVDTAKTF